MKLPIVWRHILKYTDLTDIILISENMYKEDKNLFTNFIKELSSKIHAKNKKLSIDITVIEQLSDFWSMCYDRKALSKFTDYQIIMGYDETPAGSKYAGSVSSSKLVESENTGIIK